MQKQKGDSMEKGKRGIDTKSMTQIALCVTLLSVASYLVIPLPFTPITVSIPFIPGDIIKCVIASVIGVSLNKVFAKLSIDV